MYQSGPVNAASMKLPALPFLVPSILEALLESVEYARITKVVPGEADLYCAYHVQKQGGVVLTGDSDLLVHELGNNGSVAFFRDVEQGTSADSIKALLYTPAAIAVRLGLPSAHGLRALAFEITMNVSSTFKLLLVQAIKLKAVTSHPELYQEFLRNYIPLSVASEIPSSFTALKTDAYETLLQKLDPRVSEYVLHFSCFASAAKIARSHINSTQDTPHVFLPFLLDCPARTNSFEISTSVRLLAYGLINLVVPKEQQRLRVIEHRRQQSHSGSREWQLPDVAELPDVCMALVNRMDWVWKTYRETADHELWVAFAIYQEIEWSSSNGKSSLSSMVARHLLDYEANPEEKEGYTWDVVHFTAQIQGSYYSFRIMMQILSLVALNDDSLPEPVCLLHQRIKSLPQLRDLPDLAQACAIIRKLASEGFLIECRKSLGIEEQPDPEGKAWNSSRGKGKRLHGKKERGSIDGPNSHPKSSNSFALLSD